MNEAIVTKALENLRARVAELEAERDDARAEVERLRAELDARCDKDGCEQYREWLSGEKAEADKRARQAEAERDRLAEQVKAAEIHERHDCGEADCDVIGDCDLCHEPWPCPRALGGTEAGR